MGNLFDLDSDLIKEANSSIQDELDKAYILCMREQYDKALKIYNDILDQDMKNEQAYIGLLRVHSECFTIFKGDKIEQDLRIIKRLFPNSKDQEYLDYLKAKDGNEKPKAEPKKESNPKEKKESAPTQKAKSGDGPKEVSKAIMPDVEKYYEGLLPQVLFIEDDFNKYVELTKKGASAKKANNRLEAISYYWEAVKYTNGNGALREIYYELGELYQEEGRVSKNNSYYVLAVGAYMKALKQMKPDDAYYGIITNSIGHILYYKNKDYITASYYYHAGIESWIANAYSLAKCYEKAGDYASYASYLAYYINNAINKKSELHDIKEALYQLGMLLMEGKGINKDLKEAKNVFTHLSNLGDSRGDEMLRKL